MLGIQKKVISISFLEFKSKPQSKRCLFDVWFAAFHNGEICIRSCRYGVHMPWKG